MDKFVWQLNEPLCVQWQREHVFPDIPLGLANPQAITAVTDGTQVWAAQYDPAKHTLAVCLDIAPQQELTLVPSLEAPPHIGLTVSQRFGTFHLSNQFCTVKLTAIAGAPPGLSPP